jgi:CRP-like cAMP-binding protein
VIAAGIVELVRDSGAAREVIGRIGAGEYVGEVGLLTGAPHAVTATAHTYCEVWRIPREAVAPLLSSNAVLAAHFDRSVRRGLGILQREVAMRASPSIGPAGQLLSRIRSIFASGSQGRGG